MTTIDALVLRAPGTNCEHETARALAMAGATPVVRHIREVDRDRSDLERARIVVFPGGFSYGDDLGAGRIQAEEVRATLGEPLRALIDRGGLVLGICNGFQVLVKLGLLPDVAPERASPDLSLTWNDCGHYVDRWVHLAVESSNSPFLRHVPKTIYVPIAHAEGKLVARDDAVLDRLAANGQIALRYADPDGRPAGAPWNPNGSARDIAGITDPTGRVLGLMPHPERNVLPEHHPARRAAADRAPDGLAFFVSAVETIRRDQ